MYRNTYDGWEPVYFVTVYITDRYIVAEQHRWVLVLLTLLINKIG